MPMGKQVKELKLDDEHLTIGMEDSLQEAARRLLTISGGILIVLDDDEKVKGVLGQRQLVQALADGVEASVATCHAHMEMDFLQVKLEDALSDVLADVRKRSPQAVVAVDHEGIFSGYFSPSDYQEALAMVKNLKGLNL